MAVRARGQAQLVDWLGAHQALLNQPGHHRCQPQPHVAVRLSKYQYLQRETYVLVRWELAHSQ